MPKTFTVRDLPKTERPSEAKKQCAICGRKILVGGHYFGKVPLYTDEEFEKALKAGTTKERWGKTVVEILKKDPKPYAHEEYWECDKCYFAKD